MVALLENLVPMTPIFNWLRVLVSDQPFLVQGGRLFITSVVNTIIWLTLGLLVYRKASATAQKQGLLGHY